MAKVTGAVRKVWCLINDRLLQSTEGSAEVGDVFRLLLKGSDFVGCREIKLSLALTCVWWKGAPLDWADWCYLAVEGTAAGQPGLESFSFGFCCLGTPFSIHG